MVLEKYVYTKLTEVMVCTWLFRTPKIARPVLLQSLTLRFIIVGLMAHIGRRPRANQGTMKRRIQRIPFRLGRPTRLRISACWSMAIIVGPRGSKDVGDENKKGRQTVHAHSDFRICGALNIVQVEHLLNNTNFCEFRRHSCAHREICTPRLLRGLRRAIQCLPRRSPWPCSTNHSNITGLTKFKKWRKEKWLFVEDAMMDPHVHLRDMLTFFVCKLRSLPRLLGQFFLKIGADFCFMTEYFDEKFSSIPITNISNNRIG
jgi:hypothetical protein